LRAILPTVASIRPDKSGLLSHLSQEKVVECSEQSEEHIETTCEWLLRYIPTSRNYSVTFFG
jgi:hypothetical protein